MRSMLKRQNAGEYNNGLPLMSSNPGAIGRFPYSATLSLSRFRLRTHFGPLAFVHSYRIRIKARARMPSRWDTIFRLVSGRYNSRNLGSLKRVAPLRLSRCCGAPSLDIPRLGACPTLTVLLRRTMSRHQERSVLGFELREGPQDGSRRTRAVTGWAVLEIA